MRLLLLVLLLVGPCWAQDFPVEIRVRPPGLCPGCDCPLENCFSPACDCTLPVTGAWTQGMLERIITILQRAFPDHMSDRVPVEIHAVAGTELGYTGFEQNFGLYHEGKIRISRDVSRRQAAATIAHEYAHAWHFAHHPEVDKMTEGIVEGFAEWIAYQTLKRLGDFVGTEAIRSNADPLYGVGFRWFDEVERTKGAPAVWEVALGWLDLVGTRVATKPAAGPAGEPVVETPQPEVVAVPRAPTRTGGLWMSPKAPSKGEETP